MTLATYLLYVAAVALLIVTPGPTMLMCLTNAVNHGPRSAMTSVAGAATALLAVMALSAAGLGALLTASEAAFTLLKVLGAAYLIWLGVRTFRSDAVLAVGAATPPRRSFYLQGLLVGASNPKAVLFFAAFFPQFLDPGRPVAPQFAILALTFMVLEFTVLTLCAAGVGRLVPLLTSSNTVRWINRVCGSLLALMGGALLLTRRAT
jgi:threonine/homoserine/homoserine lactone efflux protein